MSRRSARIGATLAQTQATSTAAFLLPSPKAKKPQSRKRKASTVTAQPATPPRKTSRQRQNPPYPPPETPTPAAADQIAVRTADATAFTTVSPKPRVEAVARIADPANTNAILLSPSTSRIVTSKTLDPAPSSEKPASSPVAAAVTTTTTDNILEEACRHLVSVDPRMKPLVEKHHCRAFSPQGLAEEVDPFESLCSGIISQQVSGAAAKSIKARFIALFDGSEAVGDDGDGDDGENVIAKFPAPAPVAACSVESLRTAGLSLRKSEYLRGLAQEFCSGRLSADILREAPYETVLEKLTAVRGLGRWSVEMFACFGLKRMDVFSLGDLGVQRGMAAFAGRDVGKLRGSKKGKWKYMSEKEMRDISAAFAPYRSLFMWYMWRVEDTDVSTME